MARRVKTDYASKGYKHREHRSKKGRTKDYKKKRHKRTVGRRIQLEIECKKKKFDKYKKKVHETLLTINELCKEKE